MRQESKFGAHIGTSSLLLIFLTLALVSFGALSLAGSIADRNLSDKLLVHTREYYDANHAAEAFTAKADAAARKAYAEASGPEEYLQLLGGEECSGLFPMNGSQDLAVTLSYVYPDLTDTVNNNPTSPSPFFRILKWRIENHDDMSYERHLPVQGSGTPE